MRNDRFAVGDVEGVELARRAPRTIDPRLHCVGHSTQMCVFRGEVLERVDDRHQWPVKVLVGKPRPLDPGALERAGGTLVLMAAT
jgi:hypothetical protein